MVQIGANNGHDHVYEKINNGKFQCIFIEPNPYSFVELKKTYSHLEDSIFENSAISTFDGEIDMYFNDMESGDSSHSSISLSHVLDHNNPKENITHKKVKCLMLETLLKKYSWDSDEIEWLYIDAEGHDCDIILSTDFSKLRIKNIFFETVHSDGSFKKGEKLERTFNWLYSHGYLKNARETIDNDNVAFSKP
jgi:FkbM family methyltransferase